MILVGTGKRLARLKKSSKGGVRTLLTGIGRVNMTTRWPKVMHGIDNHKGKCHGQSSYGQGQIYQEMHSYLGC